MRASITDRRFPMRPAGTVDWAAVAARYANLIYSIPLKFRLSSHDAAEVFQNTWLVALSKKEVPEDAGMAPWLAAIACWASRDLRAKRSMNSLSALSASRIADDHEPDPEEVLALAEDEQAVRDAFADLPARDRFLLQSLLLDDEPLPYAELSKRLGVAMGSISVLRDRAILKLERALGKTAAAG